jgi:hypothetical protein
MPPQCRRDLFRYEAVQGRQVVAAFDGGEITSDAGALLLGATDRAIAWSVGPQAVLPTAMPAGGLPGATWLSLVRCGVPRLGSRSITPHRQR